MRLALDRACASRPEISDRADEAVIASTITAAIATTTPIRTLDLIVIHTPKTVSLKTCSPRGRPEASRLRRDRTDSRAAEAVHSILYRKRPPPENDPPQALVSRPPVDADLTARSERDF